MVRGRTPLEALHRRVCQLALEPPPSMEGRRVLDKLFRLEMTEPGCLAAISREVLARAVGMSRDTLEKYLRELEGYGLVSLPRVGGSAPSGVVLEMVRLEAWTRLPAWASLSKVSATGEGLLSGDSATDGALRSEDSTATLARAGVTASSSSPSSPTGNVVNGVKISRLAAELQRYFRIQFDLGTYYELEDRLTRGQVWDDFMAAARETSRRQPRNRPVYFLEVLDEWFELGRDRGAGENVRMLSDYQREAL